MAERFAKLANEDAGMCKVATAEHKKKFFGSYSGLQPDLYTTLVVVVNGGPFLWTNRLTRKESAVYAPDKPVHCCTKFLVANLDKIFACVEKPSFTQTIPVDIKPVIHR
ncbi:hypothetical protein [Massilia sp. ST3]|uniref:hypothetical protein n=1 Tax=Massilia sp. ST3 TaxID=2824903 RepID=UPI001B833128|nr:hypothetical protein [Massilia sp. ST3]MBQ5946593.1 hypothetical protein [Massilia sp. ST3]